MSTSAWLSLSGFYFGAAFGFMLLLMVVVPRLKAIAGGVEPRWLTVSKIVTRVLLAIACCASAVMLVIAVVNLLMGIPWVAVE
ncbi:hypothetical protein MN032_00720 [Agromyces atrinae]|uniref:hypothetical protein n=1 Tax=Agromyces atrinae TaxID=592376 RepID=UPI001F56676F|nr:hypothetical protein [Agromyces atrinae]MCI2956196.1 hypothetical protein [Agromyces atrinae]